VGIGMGTGTDIAMHSLFFAFGSNALGISLAAD
jgi:hypothetical protein